MPAIFYWVVWGLFIGAFARLLVPGRQPIGCLWTLLLGVGGSLAGGLIATKLLHTGHIGSFDFPSFAIAVLVSALVLALSIRINRWLPDRRPTDDPMDPKRPYR